MTTSDDTFSGSVAPRVQIIGRRGCHLCEAAEEIVAAVCAERGVAHEVLSIDDDPRLADEYAEYIPVILVDGARHDFYRVDPLRLAAALDR
jgi:glutaredoxin